MNQEIYIPKILREGCVLQRGEQTRFWGWYRSDVKVTVCFQSEKEVTKTDKDGYFEVLLKCGETGGPFSLTVWGEDGQRKVIKEIYVGDVFVCSGQSNMELPIERVREMFPDEAGNILVHQYKVEECAKFKEPLKDHEAAKWDVCVKEALEQTSAVAYFFGAMIAQDKQVPVGIINISKGGTPIVAWTSEDGLKDELESLRVKAQFEDETYRQKFFYEQDIRENAWHEKLSVMEQETETAPWKELSVPGVFSEQGLDDFCGLLYLKKTFDVPKELLECETVLKLGTLVDSDKVYINGQFIGETGYCFPPRIYKILRGVLKEKDNEILIRLECRDGKGRITPDKPCGIYLGSKEVVDLRGKWQYQIRVVSEPAPELEFITRKPVGMFNGMVAPCLNMTVRGVLWYQGESDEWYPEQYEKRLKIMIQDWRCKWNQKELPFIIIQLPACGMDIRGNGAWALIRRAQEEATSLSDVVMTVNLDLGEYNDLHPLNKKGVAYRAYLAAKHLIYREQLIWQGPRVIGYERIDGGIRIKFDTQDKKALLADGKDFGCEFEAAGKDGIFYPVKVILEYDSVLIYREEVEIIGQISSIRYAWSDAPLKGLLKNHEGLLVAPFMINI